MTIHDDLPRRATGCRRSGALVVAGLLLVACSGGGGAGDATAVEDRGPNQAVPPTLAGGVELTPVDPARVLVGEALAFGAPLPSEQLAADVFTDEPEVAEALLRRVHSRRDGRLLGELLVLTLDGGELFDEGVLEAFVAGVVAGEGGAPEEPVSLAGREALRSRGPSRTAIGFVEGDLLVVMRGAADREVVVVVERQLTAIAAGTVGSTDPVTPLAAVPVDAAFVAVPTIISFQTFLPPEDEPSPEPPTLPGAMGVQGRYGVVAGERRTIVWAFTLDPKIYPSAEVLEPALAALASTRAAGAPAEGVEVIDRVVHRATGAEGSPSARAFRHQGLALLVEGPDPAQLDAVISAWIEELR